MNKIQPVENKDSEKQEFIVVDKKRCEIHPILSFAITINVLLIFFLAFTSLSNVFLVLFAFSLIYLTLGLVEPSFFSCFTKSNLTRRKIFKFFGLCFFVSLILAISIITVEEKVANQTKINPSEEKINLENTNSNQSLETQVKNRKEELTPEQKEIKYFLQDEIGVLTVEAGKGNDNIEKAGNEWQYGTPLPYVINAQIIFESVLKKAQAIKAPAGGENVIKYFIEATQYQLEGSQNIREALEEVPLNEKKAMQGLETYNKAMLSTAKTNQEINKLKDEFGLSL
jgi:hypothetical protein